jgi:Tol biopolymer transport system component
MLPRPRQRPIAALAALALALAAGAPAASGASGRANGGPTATASAAHTRIVHLTSVRDMGIYTMTPQGRDRHRIRKGWVDALSVTPNGRRMAFARERSTPCSRCTADFYVDVLLADGRGHHAHRVKRFKHAGLESVAISPDGRWIVASIIRGEGFDIYAVRANGRGVRRLTHGGGDELGVSFAPDGKRILFAREGGGGSAIYTMRLGGGGLRRISRGSGDFTDPVFSPNGRLIAFSRGDGGELGLRSLFVMRADGSHVRRLTHHGGGVEDLEADFSPNGRALVFARGTGADFELWTVPVSGGGAQRAARAGVGLRRPDWTRLP